MPMSEYDGKRLYEWAILAVKNDPDATVDILVDKVMTAKAEALADNAEEIAAGAVLAERERITRDIKAIPEEIDDEAAYFVEQFRIAVLAIVNPCPYGLRHEPPITTAQLDWMDKHGR